jgi:two-component system, response regulator PdtaR
LRGENTVNGLRIVIADASRIQREYLAGIVKQLGHDLVGAGKNGRDAIALCEKHRPDIAILDISMSPMAGSEAAPVIIDRKLATHVVIASSMTQDSIFEPLAAIGCVTIARPYRRERLERVLAALTPLRSRLTDAAISPTCESSNDSL